MDKVTLVVPCYNEENNVEMFFKVCTEQFCGASFAVNYVFVDDGSKDNTFKKLENIKRSSPDNVTVISFSRNFGKESAIFAGLNEADGDFVGVIDADLQQHPKYIQQMYDILSENEQTDCVAAYQAQRKEGAILSLFKKAFYGIANKITETTFYPGASDFRLMRKQMCDAVVNMKEYYRFSKGLFSWVGFNTEFMPYTVEQRHSGKSTWSFVKLFKYSIEGFVGYTTSLLHISTFFGVLSLIAAFVFFVVSLVRTIAFGSVFFGTPLIVTLILLFGGMQFLFLGIIGCYLSRTYMQGKDRPVYIIRRKY